MSNSNINPEEEFEFWLKEASFYIDKLKLNLPPPAEALSIILNTFDKAWLLNEIKKSKDIHVLEKKHPLVNMFRIAGKKEVVGGYELANYIKALYQQPKFSEVISMMKSARQFSTAFNQLAFAYRFLNVGVVNLEFEPSTDGGLNSDIMFKFNETVFVVESFVPGSEQNPPYDNILKVTTGKMHDRSKQFNKRVITFVTLLDADLWNDSNRKQLEIDIDSLIKDVKNNSLTIEKENYRVKVYDTSHLDDQDENKLKEDLFQSATARMDFSLMESEKQLNVRRGEVVDKKSTGSFMLRAVSGKYTEEELLKRLADKLEKKIKQTKKISVNAKGILLVEKPYLGDGGFERVNFNRIKGKTLDKHETVQSVLLIQHVFEKNYIPYYTGAFMVKEDCDDCEKILNLLVEQEWKKSFLL